MLLFIVIWTLIFIICICFKEAREEFYTFKKDFFSPDWKDEFAELRKGHSLLVSILIFILELLAFPIMYVIFLLLFPIVCIYSVLSDLWSEVTFYRKCGMRYNEWRQKQEEKENEYQLKQKLFKRFSYYGKAPFDFDRNTFLYVEKNYNDNLNKIIESHLEKIKSIFNEFGFKFIYLPHWSPETKFNDRANLDEENQKHIDCFISSITTEKYTRLLCKSLQFDVSKIVPGFFHFACYIYDGSDGIKIIRETRFTLYPMLNVTSDNVCKFCREYCELIVESRKRADGGGACSVVTPIISLTDSERQELLGRDSKELVDYKFPEDMKDIAENIKKEIEILKGAGYYELLLHTLGEETINALKNVNINPSLSRLQITDDFKILLLDYDKEVKLTPLQKTIYIFYLRHPEGVEFKMLSAYYEELLAIYRVLSNREDDEKQHRSVQRLVDVTDNAINEKCTRIKEAFLKVADDFIAKNYYIVMKEQIYKKNDSVYKDRLKKILLPQNLIMYPMEIWRIPVMNPIDKIQQIRKDLKDVEDRYSKLKKAFYTKGYSKGQLIDEFTEFINENPTHYASYHLRSILYTHVGKYNEAIADNQILIEHNERLWSCAIINKAEALYFLERYNDALEVANHYFDIEREENYDAEACQIRGMIYKKIGMTKEYKEDMKKAKEFRTKEK